MIDCVIPAEAETTTPAEAAGYIRDLATSLATLARRSDLNTLAYLLDMAVMEATANAGPKSLTGCPANPARP
jgi:hypothetical protein